MTLTAILTGCMNLLFGNFIRFLKNLRFKKEEKGNLSYGFVAVLVILLLYGLITLFSASYVTAYYRRNGDIYSYIRPQMIVAVIGVALMYGISRFNYRSLRYLNGALYVFTIALLILALFSEEQNGCHRWIYIFKQSFQPSELAKLSAVLGISCCADTHYRQRGGLMYGILCPLLPLVPFVILLRMEPHNSAIFIIALIVATMMLCGGVGGKWLLPTGIVGAVGGLAMLLTQENYVQERLAGFGAVAKLLEAMGVELGTTVEEDLYQTKQSLYAIATGGLTGLGLGSSRQKHLWLPEAVNDFIFSVLCEELGFIGALVCIVLFALLIVQGIFIALRSPDYFGMMLSLGLVSQIAWQAALHIAVCTNSMFNTGVSLPFFSSGGTSLLVLLCEMGVVLSVSRAGNAKIAAQQRQDKAALRQRMRGGEQRVSLTGDGKPVRG